MSAKVFAMGDIHGRLKAFDQCIERSGFDFQNDTLIQLGDVSDRGPNTSLVVESLLKIPHLIAIRGNHDEWTMDWLIADIKHPAWFNNGGKETIESYESNSKKFDMGVHKKFFSEIQQDFYVDDRNRIFTHGGFVDPRGPAFDNPPTICRWDRTLWNEAMEATKRSFQPERLAGFNEVYIGHTPTLNWFIDKPMNSLNVWNLDTGAGTTGKLTIMDIDTKEYWQSDEVNLAKS